MLTIAILFSENVYARLYQWTEQDTGTTQLSGKPPAWYRSAGGGPRVFVFDNGRLIDDTGVKVSEEIRQRMRRQAFILAEEDRQKAQEKMAKANELKARYKKDIKPADKVSENEEVESSLVPDESQTLPEQPDDKAKKSEEEMSVDKLRKIISEWEKAQTEKAKQSLE